MFADFGAMAPKHNAITEGVDPIQGAGRDDAHKHIPDIGVVLRFIKEGCLPMKLCSLAIIEQNRCLLRNRLLCF
jgi:hypothetical protein